MDLDTTENKELYLSVTGARYPLYGRVFFDQAESTDFEVRKGQGPYFILMAFEFEAICLLLCPV